jgi:hypothetical protein
MVMRSVILEVDLIGGLKRCVRQPGRRILFLPPEIPDANALLDLLIREQIGYREAELEVQQQRLSQLEQERETILANSPLEHDIRTGDAIPVTPFGFELLKKEIREAQSDIAAHRAALAEPKHAEYKEVLRDLIQKFEIRPASEWSAWQSHPGDGFLVKIVTYGYGLIPNPEERLEVRRITRNLPEENL